MELNEELKRALDFEKEGMKVYSDEAKKTSNPLVKRSFEFLAKEEENHIKRIHEYIEEENLGEYQKGATKDDVKRFFTSTIKEFKDHMNLSESDIDAYEKAMKLEKESYHFYSKQFSKANDEKLKNFFSFLMEQESSHYLMLEKTLKFIKDPQHFFAEEEDWSFEG